MDSGVLEGEVLRLVQETYGLWEEARVGFSWRSYYPNHTLRIRDLCLAMAEPEGADPRLLTLAALLHDVTKRYDGAIQKDSEGGDLLNEEGLWLNETVLPARRNRVTNLYERLGLRGSVHHVSGAAIAEVVLRELGLPSVDAERVAEVIRGHLRPEGLSEEEDRRRYRLAETRVLHDADVIDPNVGYPAFYRNVQIHAGFALERGEALTVEQYLSSMARWVAMKEEFSDRTLTATGRAVSVARQQSCRDLLALLQGEAADPQTNLRFGVMGCVGVLLTEAEDPSLQGHLARLRDAWLPEAAAAARASTGEARAAALAAHHRAEAFVAEMERQVRAQDVARMPVSA
ncbi:MAG TPA: HD domain-containing protein [Armatimonadota bacterium]